MASAGDIGGNFEGFHQEMRGSGDGSYFVWVQDVQGSPTTADVPPAHLTEVGSGGNIAAPTEGRAFQPLEEATLIPPDQPTDTNIDTPPIEDTPVAVDTTPGPIATLSAATQGLNPALLPPEVEDTQLQSIDQGANTLLDPDAFQATGPAAIGSQAAAAATVAEGTGQVAGATPIDASLVGTGADVQGAEGVAVERDLKQGELVSEQIAELTAGLSTGQVPNWAKPALTQVEQQLAARGLSRSSIGEAALTNAIIQAAMPIAQANAQALQRRSEINLSNAQQIQVQNLNNSQQANLQRSQQQQQVLLTDQASENAASQFNSASEQQTQQFNAQMKTSIMQNNAARITAISQFNTGQFNAMSQFNSQMDAQVEQFNVSQASAIAQSNVAWRRAANTADTAAINSATMNDANNRFKLTSQDMANRWQSLRDLAHWSQQSSESGLDRQNRIALGAMEAQAANDVAYRNSIGNIVAYGLQGGSAGGVATSNSLIGKATGAIGSAIGIGDTVDGVQGDASGAWAWAFGDDGIGGDSGAIGTVVDKSWSFITGLFD